MALLRVHVTPRAASNAVAGWRGDELSVRVTAAPDGGKANAAVCILIADRAGIAKSTVNVVRGHTSRHKTVEIRGLEDSQVKSIFGEPEAGLFD
jgi:uncharacterized protein (TIGR00251 family)